MIKKINILLLILVSTISINSFGQDEILFLNGKTLKGSILAKTDTQFTFKNLKEKQFTIDKYRVFSYKQNNTESIVYEFDTVSGNFLSQKDMKMFVFGERDAHQKYKPIVSNIVGLGAGIAGGYLLHSESSFIYVATPLVYMPITLLFPTVVNQKKIKNKEFINQDEYLRGYDRVARSKRTQGALKSSAAGMVLGIIVSAIVNNNK